jgi:hypothetical protein
VEAGRFLAAALTGVGALGLPAKALAFWVVTPPATGILTNLPLRDLTLTIGAIGCRPPPWVEARSRAPPVKL